MIRISFLDDTPCIWKTDGNKQKCPYIIAHTLTFTGGKGDAHQNKEEVLSLFGMLLRRNRNHVVVLVSLKCSAVLVRACIKID